MRTGKSIWRSLALAGLAGVWIGGLAEADIRSDQAASILIYPKIVTDTSLDTVIQVSNSSLEPVILHCFYIDANSHCSVSGGVCDPQDEQPCPSPGDLCLPGWVETDFRVVLTGRQPLAWKASQGLADDDIPLDGVTQVGPTGQSNAGTRVPPVAEEQFLGELKCIVVDENENAIPRNVVTGAATIVDTSGADLDVEKYNAIGIQGIQGDANGDRILELGSERQEYNGCPNVLIVNHFFDFAENPANGDPVVSDLTLVPCNQDLLNQVPGAGTAQYLVFNEFEQRLSTSTPIQCFFERQLSRIDTRNPLRSIFSVFVQGTLVGQTRIRGVGTGFLGLLRQESGQRTAAVNVNMEGSRAPAFDQIVLP